MSFTDDDLKRFKECINDLGRVGIGLPNQKTHVMEIFDSGALIARLEAAEEVLNNLRGHDAETVDEDLMARWRKVTGK